MNILRDTLLFAFRDVQSSFIENIFNIGKRWAIINSEDSCSIVLVKE